MNFVFTLLFSLVFSVYAKQDITLMGRVIPQDGLGRIPLIFKDMFADKHDVTYYDNNKKLTYNKNIIIYCDALWYKNEQFSGVKDMVKGKLNIAYSMIESSRIPTQWVDILNNRFDLVVVPDEFLVDVYKESGVNIPIFVLPLALNIGHLLKIPLKSSQNKIFTFGMTASFSKHKNHEKIVDAFIRKFNNKLDCQLILHGKWGDKSIIDNIKRKIANYKSKNIKILNKTFTDSEYMKFMRGLDCYILASKGEGFSITPREALALGIPCILSNNSAHSTICKQSFVRSIKCLIEESATNFYKNLLGNQDMGYFYDCSINDISNSMKYVYDNYSYYLSQASNSRSFANFYSHKNLKKYYETLVEPAEIILGEKNEIYENYLVTNSEQLYLKYKNINFRSDNL